MKELFFVQIFGMHIVRVTTLTDFLSEASRPHRPLLFCTISTYIYIYHAKVLRCCSLSRSLFLVLRMCREKQILKTTKKRAVQAEKKQTDDDEKKNLFFPFVFFLSSKLSYHYVEYSLLQ